jgi:sugar O-acyltransferase (sialic acid O-acetyltransferase NeuD family)
MAKVIIFGNGQISEVAYVYLTHDSEHEIAGFTVDKEYISDNFFHGLPVIAFEDIEKNFSPQEYKMFVPVSYQNMNKLREKKYYQAKAKGYELISYISSKAVTWPGFTCGDNCFILENNVIQPFAGIGNNVILWSGNHIGHHSQVGDHCFLASHIVVSGNVIIENNCFIGVNATIRDNIRIAAECVIGAGALLLKDTAEKGIYIGKASEKLSKSSNELKKI